MNRTFSANIIIGSAIALFAYFLKGSALLELLLAAGAQLLVWLYLALVKNRFQYASSLLSLASDGICVLITAYIWTYAKSARQKLLGTLILGVLLVPVSVAVYRSHHVILTSPLIVFGILAAIALESFSDLLSRQIHTRLLDEKKDAESSILGHLSHNVKPNIQIAKSPIVAVYDFLDERGITSQALAKRLDGSDETVGEALQKAVLSLNQIGGILDNTKKLVTQQIPREEFSEVAIVQLLACEVAPLYADRLRIRVVGNDHITLSLHKDSFVEAINNLVRNAEIHAFSGFANEPQLYFEVHETRNKVRIDYTNNGKPFPANLSAKDFISFGKKSNDSPGDGLGGAWIGKVVEAHHGSLQIIRDEHPLHFRITLPKRGF